MIQSKIYTLIINNIDNGVSCGISTIVSTSKEKLEDYIEESFNTGKMEIETDDELVLTKAELKDDEAHLEWTIKAGDDHYLFTFETTWEIFESVNLDEI